MDALFDLLGSFFPIIIAVVVAVTRVYALVQKAKAKQGNRKPSQERSSPDQPGAMGTPAPFAKNVHSWEDEFRDTGSAVTMEQGERAAALAAVPEGGDDDGEEEFSAWNLSVDEPPPPAPVPKPARETSLQVARGTALPAAPDPQQAPLSQKSFAQLAPASARTGAADHVRVGARAEAGTPTEAAPLVGADTADRAGAGSLAADRVGADTRAGTTSRVRAGARSARPLTPLQQGMVWAEILGPPKGL